MECSKVNKDAHDLKNGSQSPQVLEDLKSPTPQEIVKSSDECSATVTSMDSDDACSIDSKMSENERKDEVKLIEKVDSLIVRLAPIADRVEMYETYFKVPQFTICFASWLFYIPAAKAFLPGLGLYLDTLNVRLHACRSLIRLFYGLPMSIDGIRNNTWEEDYEGNKIKWIARVSAFVCIFYFSFDHIAVAYYLAHCFSGEEAFDENGDWDIRPEANSLIATEQFFCKWAGRTWVVYIFLSIINCFMKKRELLSRENKLKQKGLKWETWEIAEEVNEISFLRKNENLLLSGDLFLIFPAFFQSLPFTILDKYDLGDCLNDMSQFTEALISFYQVLLSESYSAIDKTQWTVLTDPLSDRKKHI